MANLVGLPPSRGLMIKFEESNPYSSHLVGTELSGLHGVPIVELRHSENEPVLSLRYLVGRDHALGDGHWALVRKNANQSVTASPTD